MTALGLLLSAGAKVEAQGPYPPSAAARRQVLALNFASNGKHVSVRVGQQIEISLGTVGPGQYGAPEISSSAVRLVNTALDWPANPGGPSFVYIFETVAEGEARVKVPVLNGGQESYANDITFTVTIRVKRARGKTSARQALLQPDQANRAPWREAWTNLSNDVRQPFIPSLPRLTGVEVELVLANPGSDSAEVSMMVLNDRGMSVAQVSKIVTAGEGGHVLFLLPRGGLPVSLGQAYSITLSSDSHLFGWKYVVGGYSKGGASFNGKPLLPGAHSTFLFRTFGAS